MRSLLIIRWHPQVAAMLAECELRLRRADVAIALANRLMETEGVSARLLNIKARGLLLAGDESNAVETWQRSTETPPTIEAHGRLAEYFAKTGDAVSEKRHRSRWLLARGGAAYRRDEIADAAGNLDRAVALDAQLDQGWYYLGLCQLARGEPDRAAECFSRCLTANPNHGRALRVIATIQSSRPGN